MVVYTTPQRKNIRQKETKTHAYPLEVVLHTRCHADAHEQRRELLGVLGQNQVTVTACQVIGRAHKEHVAAAGSQPLLLANLSTTPRVKANGIRLSTHIANASTTDLTRRDV